MGENITIDPFISNKQIPHMILAQSHEQTRMDHLKHQIQDLRWRVLIVTKKWEKIAIVVET